MGRLLRIIEQKFGRTRRIEEELAEQKRELKTQREMLCRIEGTQAAIEKKVDALAEMLGSIREKLDSVSAGAENGVSAKQLLNEYLYGEHGDE